MCPPSPINFVGLEAATATTMHAPLHFSDMLVVHVIFLLSKHPKKPEEIAWPLGKNDLLR